jgi:phosphoribosyl 1,2-cyclic phosphodiesterase
MSQQGRVVETIFLGTGTSGGVPNIPCVTPNSWGCKVCPYSLTEAGRKNQRRNTSLLVRFAHPDGRIRNILVDCGKTFYEGALAWFPRYGVNSIDAVILTHGHADAMLGLDDLRPFTRLVPEGGSIRVYLTERTLEVVKGAFPYIVDASLATGSGEIPRLVFETIKDPYAPFTVEGMTVQPIPGRLMHI